MFHGKRKVTEVMQIKTEFLLFFHELLQTSAEIMVEMCVIENRELFILR